MEHRRQTEKEKEGKCKENGLREGSKETRAVVSVCQSNREKNMAERREANIPP